MNGEVFEDNLGEFSRWRQALAWYPRDVQLKKMAARCMVIAQARQYNLPRVLHRNDATAAMLAAARFAEAALSLVFLLNRRYMPFYKWAGKIAGTPARSGPGTARGTERAGHPPLRGAEDLEICEVVEAFCETAAAHLRIEGVPPSRTTGSGSTAGSLPMRVENPEIRALSALEG